MRQPEAALALLDEGRGDVEWAWGIVAGGVVGHREKLARCAGLPDGVVRALAGDADVCVVAELAWCGASEVVAGLAGHPHAGVRRMVAENRGAPPEVLAVLASGEGVSTVEWCRGCEGGAVPPFHSGGCPEASDGSPEDDGGAFFGRACDGAHGAALAAVRQAVAGNPATPVDAVVGFADDPVVWVRQELAEREDLPQEVYARLAVDPYHGVRKAVAGNPSIGETVARVLAGDDDVEIRRELARNPGVPFDVLVPLAGLPKVGADLLPRVASASPAEVAQLAASKDSSVRALVARRRDLPDGVRDALAVDPDAKVVKSVAPHPGLSEGQLRRMVERHGVQVMAQVALNPDAPAALLEDLALREPPVGGVLRAIAGRVDAPAAALVACLGNARARPVAAAHPALPVEVLVGLLGDDDEDVVQSAAANPSLPVDVMLRLLP
ncbi:hypothetical protein ABZX85_25235 [Streptomyces sp. NPDC004539]|uniref:hypothetical protein n=1 Tax=Streptomyces sp. NPDC004539 TaxID=3154280 RepID=UPI0033BC50B2